MYIYLESRDPLQYYHTLSRATRSNSVILRYVSRLLRWVERDLDLIQGKILINKFQFPHLR